MSLRKKWFHVSDGCLSKDIFHLEMQYNFHIFRVDQGFRLNVDKST